MKHKVSELEGALLDAAVAKAEGRTVEYSKERGLHAAPWPQPGTATTIPGGVVAFSTDWMWGGRIIEREQITIGMLVDGWAAWAGGGWGSYIDTSEERTGEKQRGATALIAAMRAYVASKLGDEVELP